LIFARSTLEAEFRVKRRIVSLQGGGDESRVSWGIPAEASANHTWGMALAVEDEPFTIFFAPCLKVTPLFHATLDAEL
jgi:hypothetical protein